MRKSLSYEAIRAINDLPMLAVQAELAELIEDYLPDGTAEMPESEVDAFMHHRIINANYYEAKVETRVTCSNMRPTRSCLLD